MEAAFFRRRLLFTFTVSAITVLAWWTAYPQNIEWNRLKPAGAGGYYFISGDFRDGWNNTPALGAALDYRLTPSLSLQGALLYSKFTPKENSYPEIKMFSVPFGLKWKPFSGSTVHPFLWGGIKSGTFIFSGGNAALMADNNNESEFGYFISAGLSASPLFLFSLDFYAMFSSVLSSPEPMNLLSAGVMIWIMNAD